MDSVTNPASALGKYDFLKLMVAQMKNQNPLQPTDNSQKEMPFRALSKQ